MSDNAWAKTKSEHYVTLVAHRRAAGPRAYLSESDVSVCVVNTDAMPEYLSAGLGIAVLNLPERIAPTISRKKTATRIGFVSSYSWTRSRYSPRGPVCAPEGDQR